jgi:hypothetical protein
LHVGYERRTMTGYPNQYGDGWHLKQRHSVQDKKAGKLERIINGHYDNRIYTFPSNWPPRELSCQKSKSRYTIRHN